MVVGCVFARFGWRVMPLIAVGVAALAVATVYQSTVPRERALERPDHSTAVGALRRGECGELGVWDRRRRRARLNVASSPHRTRLASLTGSIPGAAGVRVSAATIHTQRRTPLKQGAVVALRCRFVATSSGFVMGSVCEPP
jgi:hypothetical protein